MNPLTAFKFWIRSKARLIEKIQELQLSLHNAEESAMEACNKYASVIVQRETLRELTGRLGESLKSANDTFENLLQQIQNLNAENTRLNERIAKAGFEHEQQALRIGALNMRLADMVDPVISRSDKVLALEMAQQVVREKTAYLAVGFSGDREMKETLDSLDASLTLMLTELEQRK